MFQIINMKTGAIVGTYKSRRQARRRADKLDMAYGAICYTVRPVF